MSDPLYVLTVLSGVIVLSEWLCRRGVFRHIGSALMVILLGAVAANTGVLPAGSTDEAPVAAYDAIFAYVAPIAIFWLILAVNLRDVLKAGLPLVVLFLVGAAGTTVGAVVGMRLVGGEAAVGPLSHAVAGMFTGTYTGGSVNFNAVALEYDVVRDGTLYAGSIVVDNIVNTIWIVVTLVAPRVLLAVWPKPRGGTSHVAPAAPIVDLAAETETVDPRKLALVLALGGGAMWVSGWLSSVLAGAGVTVPAILIITTLALALAQHRGISRLPGARVLGMYGVYLFLTVIGAFCDIGALGALGSLGLVLLVFAMFVVLVHGLAIFGAAWLLRIDLAGAAVASQANVGGSTTALALAKSLGREDLLVPGILLGSLGNAVGTFLGFLAARLSQ
ncbi:MAG TPA: DUF819 family protein [Vicinamibacterales bacterium]|nr:DUF819 family protein [Vicinamibacterales bacterium]